MNKHKKRKELHHLAILRSLLQGDFPPGREIVTEKPDFIIDDGNTAIGIEVTSIFHGPPAAGKPIQAQESERNALLREVHKLYTTAGNPAVHVSFHFSGESRLNKANRMRHAKTIADFVAMHLPPLGETVRIENAYGPNELILAEINSIYIHRLRNTQSTFFNMPIAGWVQENCTSAIQDKLDRKEAALAEYQECAQYWLLLVAEWSASSSFFDPSPETLTHRYRSSFHKVFFLNIFDQKLSALSVVGGAA